ncbi:MAG: YqiA/YcfP family alpha/beta fold hydrolase [Thiomicrospira sp.]
MIFYIHGYLSSGDCYKARHYKHYFGSDTVHAPTLPSSLSLAVAQLSDLIAAKRVKEPIGLIGASLGGYLALYLANYFSIPIVLINPVVPPWEGELAVSESGFCRESSHLDHLAPYRVIHFSPFFSSNILVLQQVLDEVLDSRLCRYYFKDVECLFDFSDGHRFGNISQYDEVVNAFFRQRGIV